MALRANYASIIWLSFLGWVDCSMMLYGLAGAGAGGGGRQGESAEAGVTLSLLLELMVKLCCKPLLAICEQQAFLSFFNCPKAIFMRITKGVFPVSGFFALPSRTLLLLTNFQTSQVMQVLNG